MTTIIIGLGMFGETAAAMLEEQGEPFVPNANGIALHVADVHAAVEEVKQSGAEVMGVEDSGVCHMGFVKDPDGNVLILHRRYSPRVRRVES